MNRRKLLSNVREDVAATGCFCNDLGRVPSGRCDCVRTDGADQLDVLQTEQFLGCHVITEEAF